MTACLREGDFRVETRQRERRALFGDAHYDGTLDLSAAYRHEKLTGRLTWNLGLFRRRLARRRWRWVKLADGSFSAPAAATTLLDEVQQRLPSRRQGACAELEQ